MAHVSLVPIDCLWELQHVLNDGSLHDLLTKFRRLHQLQCDHGIFLSLTDMINPSNLVHISGQLLLNVGMSHHAGQAETTKTRLTGAKRAIALLVGESDTLANDL